MTSEMKIVEEAKKPLSMHPKKFALWLFMVTVVMLFGAWTSAYIVKKGDPGWSEIILPDQFWTSSIIVVISSVAMVWAYRSARKDNLERLKLALSVTTVLGVLFLAAQVIAWRDLISLNEYFTGGNVSHSFVWVLTFFHALHVVGGIVFLFIVLRASFKNRIHSRNMVQMEMCSAYWHFLGGLWLYLFVFLLLNK